MTTEERKDRLTRLRAICGARRAIVTKNVGMVNDITRIEEFISSEHVHISQLNVISHVMQALSLVPSRSVKHPHYCTDCVTDNKCTFQWGSG